jgi:hypothetical protein
MHAPRVQHNHKRDTARLKDGKRPRRRCTVACDERLRHDTRRSVRKDAWCKMSAQSKLLVGRTLPVCEVRKTISLNACSNRELSKRFPIEAHPVTRAHRSDRHALLQDQGMLDVSIKAKPVRLQVRAIWTCRE